jgi:muramoyltetrapeptide carboxypeptidase
VHPLLYPRALSPGDLVAVAALSGPMGPDEEALLARGVTVIESMGFRVRVSPAVSPERRRWWSTGTPAEHAEELNSLLRDPQVRAIVSSTGGQTVLSYLDLVDYDAVLNDPKPIIGYSDISALNLALHSRTGLVGFHGDLATLGFGSVWFTLGDRRRREELVEVYRQVLTGAVVGELPAASRWECWNPGRAKGPLLGGLLNRIVRLQGTPFGQLLERFDGAILFWEEIGRSVNWVANDLELLRLSGVLDRISGMVVGICANVVATDAGPKPPTLRDVVGEALRGRDIPVLGNVDFGHISPNLPLPVGIRAGLDADARTLSLLEPAVVAVSQAGSLDLRGSDTVAGSGGLG